MRDPSCWKKALGGGKCSFKPEPQPSEQVSKHIVDIKSQNHEYIKGTSVKTDQYQEGMKLSWW